MKQLSPVPQPGLLFFYLSNDITLNPLFLNGVAKRLSETNIWKTQRWFKKLSPAYKLAFFYIKDQCDHAGIWNVDCSDLIEDLGIDSFDLSDFVEKCNTEYDKMTGAKSYKERVRILDKGYIWVTGFFQFQYKGKEGLVNPLAKPVITAIQMLIGVGVFDDALSKGYITLTEPFHKGLLTPKDKDKDKDKKTKNGKSLKGLKIEGELVFFEDGSSQVLGPQQSELLEKGELKPRDVIKNSKY